MSKEALAEQLSQVCETLKKDENDLFVQGLGKLQAALLDLPLRKMKPVSFGTSMDSLHSFSNPNKEVSESKFL